MKIITLNTHSIIEPDYENKLSELELIVKKLESNEISLDEAISLFEDGVKISDDCRKILESAERKIKTLTECEGEANND